MNYLSIFVIFSLYVSCMAIDKGKRSEEAVLHGRLQFYDVNGKPTAFKDTSIIWYSDSTTIQEFHTVDTVTDTLNVTTTSYRHLLHRFIDLRSRTWYNYITFSDTAKIIDKGILPDTAFKDYGWSYFSDKVLIIQGMPQMLTDTIIDQLNYKRAKFHFIGEDTTKSFEIGYLRCDGKGELFALQKSLSRDLNCTMTKLFSYRSGSPYPYGGIEIDFIADELFNAERKVFEAWKQNAKNNPIPK